jgi:uncharacterized protein involved in exopolysaccharide biosynthesis
LKQSTQSGTRGVECPTEIEPVSNSYIGEDANGGRVQDSGEWIWLLWERRRFLWRITVLSFVTATIAALLIPKRYESTIRLMPPDQHSGSGLAILAGLAGKGSSSTGGGLGLPLGSIASDLLGTKTSGALFADILRGRTVQDRLVERFDLRKVYWDRYWEEARNDLRKRTDVAEDRKSGVLTITVTDRDPRRAEKMAEAYVEELDRLVAEVSTSSARRERIFIERRLATVRQELEQAAQEFSQFASKNSALDIKEQTKAMVESGAVLQGQLIAAHSELQGLEQIYTPNNVRVRSLKAKVAELEHQLQNMSGDSSAPSPEGKPNTLYPPIRQLPLLGVRWAELYRETKIQETVYELLTQQYEMAKIEEAKEIPVVKVLDAANVPEKKSFPPLLITMILGTMLALAGAIAWIFGNEAWKKADPRDPRKLLLQEVVADVMTHLSWVSQNNSDLRAKAKTLRDRFHRRAENDRQNGNEL